MARSIWSGSISFGLVSIPVKAYTAIREHDVHFHLLAPDGSRVHNQRVSERSGRAVEYRRLKKGYETSKGKYVVFEQDELKALAPASTKTIDIEDFVPLEDIDPIFFARTYHLAPGGDGAEREFALLTSVMEDRQRVGIGRVVMREKQYLAAVRPYGKGLAMSTMLFADEVVPQSKVEGIPTRRPQVDPRERKLAEQIVDSLEGPWKPDRYHDDYEEELRRRIKSRQQGKVEDVEEDEAPPAKVVDLMEELQASLDRSSRASSRRKSTTKAKRTSSRAQKAPKASRAKSPAKSTRTKATRRKAS